jgi:tRNA-2-methylthio-N6-dimethylallyladenosine synthase
MVAEGEGRKDLSTGRLSGRAPDNRLVHFAAGDLAYGIDVRPGDVVTVTITRGAPHYLEADGGVLNLRRTRSGDAWEKRQGAPADVKPSVGLGMPSLGVPAPLSDAPACG